MKRIAIIGGSGLEDPNILESPEEKQLSTPYGKPSSSILLGKIKGKEVALLSRHDRQHTIPPSQINNRANIYALKKLNCEGILATTACGSLRSGIQRGDLVLPDQFIDFTRQRITSYFEKFEPGNMKHTAMPDPFNANLRNKIVEAAQKTKQQIHETATIVTIEGPRFSTRAESKMFRAWGADIINMSTAPEVILANELGIPYAAIAMSTDYDSWKEDETAVSWEEILETFHKNVDHVIQLIMATLEKC